MVSLTDHLYGTYLTVSDNVNIFTIPFHSVQVLVENEIHDITRRLKRLNLFGFSCTTSKNVYIQRYHQIFDKQSNKIYILCCSIYDILSCPNLIPRPIQHPIMIAPRKQLLNDYTIYINNSELSINEIIYLRKHDKNNLIQYIYHFMNKVLHDACVYKDGKLIKDFNKSLCNMTISDIYAYL
jgi:hypothetical protein